MKKGNLPWQIFLAALIFRLVPVLLTRPLGIGLDDMFQYDMLVRSLASGNGYRWYAQEDLRLLEPYINFDLSSIEYDPVRGVPTSFRAPLYPAFLALIYIFVGTGPGRFFAARLIQAGLNAFLAPLTYYVSRRLFPRYEPAAVISAWIVVCYPMLVIYPIGLATENLFFLLVLASFYFLIRIPDFQVSESNPQLPFLYPLLAGLFLALAILTRSVILPFAGLAVLWVWFILKQRRAAVIIVVTMSVLILPWIVRNSLLHQKLTGIESSMGYNLYVGYYPGGNGSFLFGPSLDLVPILDDARRDQLGTQKALEFFRAEPERIFPLTINRLGFFFGLEKRALVYLYSNNLLGFVPKPLLLTIAAILLLPFVFIAIFAAFGFSLTYRNPEILLLNFLLFAYILPHALILSEDRFHLTLVPFLATLAARAWAGGLNELTAYWRGSLAGKLAVSFSCLVVVLFFVNWGFELFRDADKIATLLGPLGNQTYFPY